jgi:hypothetical protein
MLMIPNMTLMIEKIPRTKAINTPMDQKTDRQKEKKN